jgi:hypothetical protein
MKITLSMFQWKARRNVIEFDAEGNDKEALLADAIEKAKKILRKSKVLTHGRITLPDNTDHLVIR